MLWMIHCVDAPDAAQRRAQARPEHLSYLASQHDKLVLSGATQTDDGEHATGSCFIVAVESRAEAEAFSDGDPFVKAGVFETITVTRMRKGHWHPEVGDRA